MREELLMVIKSGVSQAKIAADLGVSAAMLSQWLNGKYAGDNEKFDKAVEGFLARRRGIMQQDMLFYPADLVETTATTLLRNAAMHAYRNGEIAVVYGNAGSGKTSAVKAFAFQNQER